MQVWGGTRNPPPFPSGVPSHQRKVGTAWCSDTVGGHHGELTALVKHPAVTEVAQWPRSQLLLAHEARPGHTGGLPTTLPPAAGFQEAEGMWLGPVLGD